MATFPPEFVLPQKVRLRSLDETQVASSQGGITHKNRIGFMHRWGIDLTTPKLNYAKVMHLYSFVCSMGGRFGTCVFQNPHPPIGKGIANAFVRTSAEQGVKSVPLYAMNNSVVGALMPGDWVQFANHTKAYMVTAVLNTNGLGQGTVEITPNLRKAIPAGTSVKSGTEVNFTVELKSDDQDILLRADQGKELAVQIDFVEYLND